MIANAVFNAGMFCGGAAFYFLTRGLIALFVKYLEFTGDGFLAHSKDVVAIIGRYLLFTMIAVITFLLIFGPLAEVIK